MLKLLGSLCILAAGGMAWMDRRRTFRQTLETLTELLAALEEMESAIRLERLPMPRLLSRAALRRDGPVGMFFQTVVQTLRRGEDLVPAWRQAVGELSLSERDRSALAELGEKLTGDETRACQGIQLVSRTLTASLENLRKQQPEREKRGAALWFSGAALLIILLI